jgi:[ribosomal protein S5]-alanine N-acetyltransferase
VNVVETERLTLREFADADVDALYEIQGDRQHMRFTFSSASREDCENWLRRYARTRPVNGFAPWTIVHRADNRIIGWGGLSIDPLAPGWGPEVAYFIHQACAGQGYATEVVRASLQCGFRDLRLNAIGAFAMPQNLASVRVLEKCGFRFLRYEPAVQRDHFEIRLDNWRGRQAAP